MLNILAGGSGRDTHITTWAQEKFDFHGHCDLVLLKSAEFSKGKGISVHVQSSQFQTAYSYISAVAIKIGDDVLEFGGHGEVIVNGD